MLAANSWPHSCSTSTNLPAKSGKLEPNTPHEVTLPVGSIIITGKGGSRKLESILHEYCDDPDGRGAKNDDPACCEQHQSYNAAIDGIESLVLAHACAGIDVSSKKYIEGLQTALDAVAHYLGDH